MRQIDRVLDDIDFGVEVRGDVHRGVANDQRVGIARHVHDEAVADPAGRPNAGLSRHHSAHQLIGVQAALHERLDLARRDQLYGLGGRVFTMLGIHELERTDVDVRLPGNCPHSLHRTYKDGVHQPQIRRLDHSA